MAANSYTAVVEKEGDGYVALCPELDVASQGATVEEAMANLKEAVGLFLECADPEEVQRRVEIKVSGTFLHPSKQRFLTPFSHPLIQTMSLLSH